MISLGFEAIGFYKGIFRFFHIGFKGNSRFLKLSFSKENFRFLKLYRSLGYIFVKFKAMGFTVVCICKER